jgi:hypothetical protein
MFKNLEEALKRLGGQIDFLNEKAEATFGQEKVNLLKQQIPLLRQQQKIQEQIAMGERSQNNELIYWLNNNGFKFDGLGNIENYNEKLLSMEENLKSLKEKYDSLSDSKNKDEGATKKAKAAYESANEVIPTYYDVLLEGKLARDTDTIAMLDILFDTIAYEVGGNYFGFESGLSDLFYTTARLCFNNKSTDFASWYKGKEKTSSKLIERFYKSLDELEALD